MSKRKKYTYNKEELIKEVKKNSKVGKLIIKAEMEFLRALAKGEIYQNG